MTVKCCICMLLSHQHEFTIQRIYLEEELETSEFRWCRGEQFPLFCCWFSLLCLSFILIQISWSFSEFTIQTTFLSLFCAWGSAQTKRKSQCVKHDVVAHSHTAPQHTEQWTTWNEIIFCFKQSLCVRKYKMMTMTVTTTTSTKNRKRRKCNK